mmetsp:Transcript_28007/g.78493  ORF Transcript_28007/g.78493 Transcript_28007/m.78493 type:complete len:404 (+) Transcript_28007:480-1691(+)
MAANCSRVFSGTCDSGRDRTQVMISCGDLVQSAPAPTGLGARPRPALPPPPLGADDAAAGGEAFFAPPKASPSDCPAQQSSAGGAFGRARGGGCLAGKASSSGTPLKPPPPPRPPAQPSKFTEKAAAVACWLPTGTSSQSPPCLGASRKSRGSLRPPLPASLRSATKFSSTSALLPIGMSSKFMARGSGSLLRLRRSSPKPFSASNRRLSSLGGMSSHSGSRRPNKSGRSGGALRPPPLSLLRDMAIGSSGAMLSSPHASVRPPWRGGPRKSPRGCTSPAPSHIASSEPPRAWCMAAAALACSAYGCATFAGMRSLGGRTASKPPSHSCDACGEAIMPPGPRCRGAGLNPAWPSLAKDVGAHPFGARTSPKPPSSQLASDGGGRRPLGGAWLPPPWGSWSGPP